MNCGATGAAPLKKLHVKVLNCICNTKPWAGIEYWDNENLKMFSIRCPRCYANICGVPPDNIEATVNLWNAWANGEKNELSWF
jgi:hypothetical protein